MVFRNAQGIAELIAGVERARVQRDEILRLAASVLRRVDQCQKAVESAGIERSAQVAASDSQGELERLCSELDAGVARITLGRQKIRETQALLAERDKARATWQSEQERLTKELRSFFTRLVDVFQGSRRRKALEEAAGKARGLGSDVARTKAALNELRAAAEAEVAAACPRSGLLHAIVNNFIQKTRLSLPSIGSYVSQLPLEVAGAWSDSRWRDWPPKDSAGKPLVVTMLTPALRYGEFEEQPLAVAQDIDPLLGPVADGLPSVRIPVYVPLIGAGRSVRFTGNPNKSLPLIQSLVVRAAIVLGQQIRFTLLDPHGLGQAFPMQRFLNGRKNSDDVFADLRDVEQDIRRVNQEVLAGEEGLHLLDPTRLASESFELVVAANFPRGYDRRAVESLFRIAQSGPRAGRHVLFHHDPDYELPREMSFDQIRNLVTVDVDGQCVLDSVPEAEMRQRLLESVRSAKAIEHAIDAAGLLVPPEETWWRESSQTAIATPIGVRGAADMAEIGFGVHNGLVCAHGAIAAMTGSGKSSLIHVIVLGLATRYSPDELRMYLIDGKAGSELAVYERLPHAAVVALESPAEMSRSVLEDLVREMKRRNALFVANQVQDIVGYRAKVGVLPRLLLLIDEYQTLFEDDRDGHASENLRKLATQGRSAGIHMLLGSHRFGAPGMLHHKDIFGNVHLKIGMKMETSDIAALTEFGPLGKQLLRGCDMAGKFAINVTGKDEDTISGKAGLLQADVRQNVIARLVVRGGGRQPVVFRGDADHRLTENPAFRSASSVRPTAKQRSELARREESQGGWGQSEWVEADSPLGFWLGRRPNMHGQAMVVLRRTVEQNLLVVADKAAARAGMISSVVRSLGCLYGPKELVLRVSHAGPNDGCPTVAAAKVDALQRSGFTALMARDPDSTSGLLDEFLAELDQRTSNPQLARTAPAWVWILIEPDRAAPLRRTGDALGRGANPRTERIRKLLESGPANGLHWIVFTTALRLVSTVFDERRDLGRFGHRVALQMSEDDSFALFRSRLASQLQQSRYASESDAIYHNSETGRSVKFRPYLLE